MSQDNCLIEGCDIRALPVSQYHTGYCEKHAIKDIESCAATIRSQRTSLYYTKIDRIFLQGDHASKKSHKITADDRLRFFLQDIYGNQE